MSLAPAVLALFCCVGMICNASAEENKPPSALPGDGFQFAGTWDCEGSFGNGRTHKALFTGASILDNKWLELTEKDIEPATGYLAKYLIGYDSEQKTLVEYDANNFGAAVYSSPNGWQNRVLTMTSSVSQDPKAAYAANRFLYSVVDQNTFRVDWQIGKTAALNWVLSDHLVCKRKAAESAQQNSSAPPTQESHFKVDQCSTPS